jgi:arylsulfatase A-like enzyme
MNDQADNRTNDRLNGRPAASGGRPNVLLILTDDQGAWALGCAGNAEIRTPNLDRLAERGMRFTDFFCVSPVCSPARASLFTGRIPSSHGVHDWIRAGDVDPALLPPEYRPADEGGARDAGPIDYLQDAPTFPELLAEQGYVCGLSGKWHLGRNHVPRPGFQYWFTNAGAKYMNPGVIEDGQFRVREGYMTDMITDHALRFLERHAGKEAPFYLSVHYTAPHGPWAHSQHPAEYLRLYADCAFASVPDEPPHPGQINSAAHGTGAERVRLLQGYYAAITAMDSQVGRLLDRLEAQGLLEDTLIVFTSDNGMNMGHHGVWGKGNGTFPQNMYEESVKVPFIVSRPGSVPEGRVCGRLLSHYDVMPTVFDYLGIELPPSGDRPGRSFAGLLRGGESDAASGQAEPVVVFDEYGPVRMIRSREWKYVHRYPYGPHELYDLKSDPGERRNRIAEDEAQPVVQAMKAQLDEWFVRYANSERDGAREAVTGRHE